MPRKPGSHSLAVSKNARQRIWTSMRVLRRFTAPDLVATAEAKRDNVRRYILALAKVGYVAKVGNFRGGRPGVCQQWQLVRNTGPDTPRVRPAGDIYDPNIAKVVSPREEVAND